MHQQLDLERQIRKKKIREEFKTARNEQQEFMKLVDKQKKSRAIEDRKRKNNEKMGKLGLDLETDDKKKVKPPKQRKIAKDYRQNGNKINDESEVLSMFFG